MPEKIHLLSGLSDEQAMPLRLQTEKNRFAAALGVEPIQIQVHNMIAITTGEEEMPNFAPADLAIIGGSPEVIVESTPDQIERERELVKRLITASNRIFAVCYGFQLLVRALDGEIGKAQPGERGYRKIEFTEDHPVLEGISEKPTVSTFHGDAVHKLPKGLRSITKDDSKGIQMAVGIIKGTEIVATQFHPEILTKDAPYLNSKIPPDPEAIHTLETNDEIEGPKMLENFYNT